MSIPPPPTFRAPTRESMLLLKGKIFAHAPMENDLSFMDPEMKRLHHNVTNILATASTPPPASRARHRLSGPSTLPATRGDSDDDSADDEPALAVLSDSLRSTNEKFFERISPKPDGPQRRGSSFVSGRRKLSKDATQGAHPPSLRHERQSWKGLAVFEKGLGGMIRQPVRSVSTPPESTGPGNGHPARHGARAECDQDRGGAPRPPIGDDGNPIRLQNIAPEVKGIAGYCRHPSSVKRPSTMHVQSSSDSKAVLMGLRARSDEATRTLATLKKLIDKESKDAATPSNDGSNDGSGVAQRKTTNKYPSSGVTGESNAPSNHVTQLLRAMENLQQINTELSAELAKASASGKGARSGFRRSNTVSPYLSRQTGTRPRQRPRFFSRVVQSSSDLLARRKSEKGQNEPMSCGVPRYRVEKTKRGADKVYFELAITQSKSTWTVERRIDEFFDLHRSLVKTASDLAKAEAKKGGNDGGAYSSVDFRRVGEARVPDLNVKKTSWLEKTPLRSFLYRRSREEMLVEKQVLLASWLANVLADSTLMSADLVRFLGGDVAAQPVVEDAGDTDVYDEEASELWNTSGSDFSEEGYCSYEDDDRDILEYAQAGGRVSPYPRQGFASAKDQHERLARDTVKRVALIRDESPTFPDYPPIISLGRGNPSYDRVGRRGVNVIQCFDAKVANGWWGDEVDDDEDEYDEEDENVGDKPVIPGPTVPPSFISPGHWSDDSAMRGTRGPSPSSPTPSVMLDAFFLAPA
ncbi:unnamed protein product [Ascophyllum nodosum]